MKKELVSLIEESVDESTYFIVGIHIIRLGGIPHIKLTIDSDRGISIDECTEISRMLYSTIENSGLAENFELEVGSPGLGEPLKLHRQYVKNVGRVLQVVTNSGIKIEGTLLSVDAHKIALKVQEKVRNIVKSEKTIEIELEHIKKATIKVLFNN